jgi:hypothetical protein
MMKVVVTDSRGTYYPIAFFAYESEAREFVEREKPKWRGIYYAPCESAVMLHTLVDESKWRTR